MTKNRSHCGWHDASTLTNIQNSLVKQNGCNPLSLTIFLFRNFPLLQQILSEPGRNLHAGYPSCSSISFSLMMNFPFVDCQVFRFILYVCLGVPELGFGLEQVKPNWLIPLGAVVLLATKGQVSAGKTFAGTNVQLPVVNKNTNLKVGNVFLTDKSLRECSSGFFSQGMIVLSWWTQTELIESHSAPMICLH